MGLTGLEVVGKDGESLPLDLSMMVASPRDLNDLPEYGHDLRTLDKYVKTKCTRSSQEKCFCLCVKSQAKYRLFIVCFYYSGLLMVTILPLMISTCG